MSWTYRSALSIAMLALGITLLAPAARTQWTTGDLRSTGNRADYLIITTKDLVPTVTPLAAFRASRNGFAVMIVLVDSIAAQFRRASPDSAIRDFLEYAVDHWQQPRPACCLLAGAVDRVPSHTLPSSFAQTFGEDSVLVDQWLVTRAGAAMPYPPPLLALGRMVAWNAAQLQAQVEKTIAYEQAEPGPWARRAIALADSSDMSFWESEASDVLRAVAPGWPDTIAVHLRPTSPCYRSPAAFRSLWGEGCAFVSFIGHQNWQRFSSWYFAAADADSLAQRSELPVCTFIGAQPFSSPDTIGMAVALLTAQDRGAVAVIAPSGLMYAFSASEFQKALFTSLTAHRADPIGLAWKTALSAGRGDIDIRWMIFGDPALVVKRADLAAVTPPGETPTGFSLHQNYPNPFNPSTMVRFALPAASFVTVRVYNALGQEVATLQNGVAEAGLHEVRFDATGLASGVYLCRMQAGSFAASTKMLLVR